MKKQLLLSLFISLLFFISCDTQPQQAQTVIVETKRDSLRLDSSKHETTINKAQKTDNEILADAAIKMGGDVIDAIKAKRQRDSIELANRGQVLVYQIGMPKSDKEELWNSYSQIKNLPGIYVFKADDNYYLIKVTNYNEQAMQDSLNITTAALMQRGISESVKVLNILSFCKRKETITQGKKVKIKHQDDIPCYVCN